MTIPAAVFASGGGTNLQSLLDHEETARDPAYRVELVVSDREGAGALERAAAAGRSSRVIPVSGREGTDVAEETLGTLERAGIGLVLLAGYLRLIPAPVVEAFRRRILNIHPALLPAFGGKGMYGRRVHEAVLASSARISGPTVHYVDERYDEGGIVAQWPVPVRAHDTPKSLAARVLAVEHLLYPEAAAHVARSVERGVEPAPWSPPAGAYVFGSGEEASVAEEIRRCFGASRE